jgi:hypothetical protein
MLSWLLRQLNISDDFKGHLDEVSFSFRLLSGLQTPYYEAAIAAIALVVVGLAVLIYLRQKWNLGSAPPLLRTTLTVTRVLILLMLVGVLLDPSIKLDHRSEKKPIVALLFDHSQSMQLPAGPFDSEGELSRIAVAAGYRNGVADGDTRKALNRIGRARLAQSVVQNGGQPLMETLAKKFELQYYSFSRDVTQLGVNPAHPELPEPPNPGGSSTQAGDAIAKVMEEAAGRQVAGILVFSDGQNTGGRSPIEAAQSAAALGTPVFTVPAGSSQRLTDVAIVDLFTSGLVSKGDTARVAVTIESPGFERRPVKVELKDGDKLLDSKEIILRNEQQQVELTFKANDPGAHYLTVSIPPQPEEPEYLRGNNTDTAFVRVSDEKLKVLYVEGLPRWDYRFLKNAMRRDNGLGGRTPKGVDMVLEAEWRRLPPPEQAKALPRTLDALADYHAVILGDVSPKLLDAGFVELLDKAVRERGVGLIVEAGPLAMPHSHGDKLHELLPVRLRGRQAGQYPRGIPSFRIELAPEGSLHEAMRFYDEPGRNQNAWANLAPYFWCAAAERPAPGASVLAWNPIQGDYGKLPLIAQHYAGKGKVLFVGTDSTWLWRRNVGDRFFYKFWGQGLRSVARRDGKTEKKSWVEVRPVRAQPGEQAQIELMAFNPDGSPRTDKTLGVQVQGGGSATTVELAEDPAVKGRYTGKFTPSAAGEYRIAYNPSGADPVEARLRVAVAPEELRQPNVNRPALEQWASASGGQMVELPDLAVVADRLQGDSKFTEFHREASLWDNWLTLALLIFIYSLDVGLRRLVGLS